MRFSDLYVRRFRTLREVHLRAANLRVLIGRNGAGKSTLLEAIESISVPGLFSTPEPDAAVDGDENEVFAIYELDDDLSEGLCMDYSVWWRGEETVRQAVKSSGAFEMLCSLLGPESFKVFMEVVEEAPGHPTGEHIDIERLKVEFDRAALLFQCVDIQALSHLSETAPEFAQFREEIVTSTAYAPVGLDEVEPTDLTVVELGRDIAQRLLPLTLATQRIAWTGMQYAGVAIRREEVDEDLGEDLSRLAAHKMSRHHFYYPMDISGYPMEDGSLAAAEALRKNLCRGISWGHRAPIFGIADQWASQAPFILVSLTPGVGKSRPWHNYRSQGISPVGPGYWAGYDVSRAMTEEASNGPTPGREFSGAGRDHAPAKPVATRAKERYSVGGMVPVRDADNPGPFWTLDSRRMEDRGPGPPGLSVVAAQADIRELEKEIDKFLPAIHDHIWASTSAAITPGTSRSGALLRQLPPAQLRLVYNDEAVARMRGGEWGSNEPLNHPLKTNYQGPDLATRTWLIPADAEGSTNPPSWQIRPGLPVACHVLAYCANEIAPLFVRAAGDIEITTVPDPRYWQSGHLKVTFNNQPLDELPEGIARWVAISLRLAGRRLVESQIWLPAIWGNDKTLKEQYLSGIESRPPGPEGEVEEETFGIALHAIDVMTRENGHLKPEGGLVFEIESDEHEQTLLLIDEPEANLHLDALEEVRDWLKDRLTDWSDLMAVVATHSPAIFNYTSSEARITSLERTVGGEHTVQDITEAGSTLGEWLLEFGPQLGVETLDGLFLYRGFLLVEGPHDVTVLDRFYGDELKERRILPVPLWGIKGRFDLTEARILRYARKPAALLVDNIGYEGIEARQLVEVTRAFQDQNIPFYGDGHDAVDVIFTLPETAVRRYLDDQGISGTFAGGWAEMQEHIRALRIPNKSFPKGKYLNGEQKKKKAEELLGLTPTRYGLDGGFIEEIISRCEDSDRPAETLETTMRQIFEFFDSPHEPRDTEPF